MIALDVRSVGGRAFPVVFRTAKRPVGGVLFTWEASVDVDAWARDLAGARVVEGAPRVEPFERDGDGVRAAAVVVASAIASAEARHARRTRPTGGQVGWRQNRFVMGLARFLRGASSV